jgi:hypothetical protein
MRNKTEHTEANRQYATAYAAHYTEQWIWHFPTSSTVHDVTCGGFLPRDSLSSSHLEKFE